MNWRYVVALLLVGAAFSLVMANEYVHSRYTFDITQMEDYDQVTAGL